MAKFQLFTFYKSDGTKLPIYGTSPLDALDGLGLSVEEISEQLKFCREGMDDSLVFINDKWQRREGPEVKVVIQQEEFNKN
jgi:hypothetical protein